MTVSHARCGTSLRGWHVDSWQAALCACKPQARFNPHSMSLFRLIEAHAIRKTVETSSASMSTGSPE
jgi:hypothetical protein